MWHAVVVELVVGQSLLINEAVVAAVQAVQLSGYRARGCHRLRHVAGSRWHARRPRSARDPRSISFVVACRDLSRLSFGHLSRRDRHEVLETPVATLILDDGAIQFLAHLGDL